MENQIKTQEEIDLKDIYEQLINSKKFIFFFTIFILLISFIISLTNPQKFNSSATVSLGYFNHFNENTGFFVIPITTSTQTSQNLSIEKTIHNLAEIYPNLRFNENIINSDLILQITSDSEENNKDILNNSIDKITNVSNQILDAHHNQILLKIDFLRVQMEFYENQIAKLSRNKKSDIIEVHLASLKAEVFHLKLKLDNVNRNKKPIYSKAKNDFKSVEINKKITLKSFAFVGFIGFILSILIIFLRNFFLKD
jgi:hypothetical protein